MTEGQTITGVRAEPVPFLDLRSSHDPIREALLDDFRALTVSGAFTNGPHVAEFEDGLRRLLRGRPLRGDASGLDALRLALGEGLGSGR